MGFTYAIQQLESARQLLRPLRMVNSDPACLASDAISRAIGALEVERTRQAVDEINAMDDDDDESVSLNDAAAGNSAGMLAYFGKDGSRE